MVTVPVLGTVSSYLLLIFTKSPYLIKVNPVKKKLIEDLISKYKNVATVL